MCTRSSHSSRPYALASASPSLREGERRASGRGRSTARPSNREGAPGPSCSHPSPPPSRQSRHEVNIARDSSARQRRPSGQSRLIAPEPVPTRSPAPRPSRSPRDPCGKRLFPVVSGTCAPNLKPGVTGAWKPSRYIRHRGRAFHRSQVTLLPGERPTKPNPLDDLHGRSTEFVPRVSHERHLADAPPTRPRFVPSRGTSNTPFPPRLAAFLVPHHYIS